MKNLFFLLILFSFFSCNELKKIEKQKPNVVIILVDDLGYGDISCYGQENYKTPNIDKMADQGILCTDFYVPTPYCAPSRATLLTGRFPLRHKLVQNPTPDAGINDIGLSSSEITLAELFHDAGYATKLIGKWHLGHKEEFFPVNHGFDEYYGILYSNDMRPVQIIENKDTVEYPVDQRLLTQKYTKKAIEFITEHKDKPFFLNLNHAMPHKPLAASEKFHTPETPNDLYVDVIRELDWSIGEVIKTMENLKILDNTILIFMSDNGPWYGGNTGGLKGMKATTWEGGLRVPFIIRYPKTFEAGKIINTPCWSPDIFPTLLSLAGFEYVQKTILDGDNITDVLQGNTQTHKSIFGMQGNEIEFVRKGDYKLFVKKPRYKRLPDDWIDERGPDGISILAPIEQARPKDYPGIVPGEPLKDIQLFNLKEDKTESNDLSESKPEIVKELLKEYEAFKKSIK